MAKPDIVLIMADQLVPMLTGAYGHPVVQTPNLDALAGAGVRFDAAYSPSPLCAPARACLKTGTYGSTNRSTTTPPSSRRTSRRSPIT
jgi:choline-sulfatase